MLAHQSLLQEHLEPVEEPSHERWELHHERQEHLEPSTLQLSVPL